MYVIQLLYKDKPVLDREALYGKMQQYTGEIHCAEDAEEAEETGESLAVWESSESEAAEAGEVMHFFHLNHMIEFQQGALPAQTCIMPSDKPVEEEAFETALQQAWHWPEARAAVAGCRHSLMLTDFFARGLEYKERLKLISGALRALLETAPCEAVYFQASDKIVHPQAYAAAVEAGQRLYGAMNLRFYNVHGRDEMIMDTCGLAAIGLPDVQCHFRGLEPNEVASWVGDIAYYLYEHGDIIQDGETVGSEEIRWHCEHQLALAAPMRHVLDLNPGPEHYAGIQHHGRDQRPE
ncbi:DUF4261 domain-containing protein [Paenibacillus dendritiformis]|nr:DUF4261 domain-containing protein [Paenibacillus dendritiformis]NRG00874.1 DUF4261 domain-containing protein [Paenibacillus dendritiformis]